MAQAHKQQGEIYCRRRVTQVFYSSQGLAGVDGDGGGTASTGLQLGFGDAEAAEALPASGPAGGALLRASCSAPCSCSKLRCQDCASRAPRRPTVERCQCALLCGQLGALLKVQPDI